MEKTIKQLALEHWNKIACGSSVEEPDGYNCPYCREFLDCYGCRISIVTGSTQCRNTSYYEILDAWRAYRYREIWQARCADEIEAMIELIESLPEE